MPLSYPSSALSQSLGELLSDAPLVTFLSNSDKHIHFFPNIPFLLCLGEDSRKSQHSFRSELLCLHLGTTKAAKGLRAFALGYFVGKTSKDNKNINPGR